MKYPGFLSSVESDVVVKLKNRDPQFLAQIFSDINPYMIRVLSGHGFYGEQAEDIIHQTWETFFTNLEKFEGRSQLKTFMVGILINKVREARRSNKKIVFEEDQESYMENSFTPEGWWKRPPEDPQRFMESAELSEFLKECIEGLNEIQKTAFLLVEIEEESSNEICNILNVTATHLRVLLFRAKEKLRACMSGKLST